MFQFQSTLQYLQITFLYVEMCRYCYIIIFLTCGNFLCTTKNQGAPFLNFWSAYFQAGPWLATRASPFVFLSWEEDGVSNTCSMEELCPLGYTDIPSLKPTSSDKRLSTRSAFLDVLLQNVEVVYKAVPTFSFPLSINFGSSYNNSGSIIQTFQIKVLTESLSSSLLL